MIKKTICWLLVLFFASLVFFFSAQNSTESASISSSVTEQILEVIPAYNHMEDDRKPVVVNTIHTFIRSLAHFGLFLCLGASTALALKCYPKLIHPYALSMILCILYAISDELHQKYFSQGRAFEFVDLLKDWSGSVIGIASVALLYFLFRNKNIVKKLNTEVSD